MRRPATPDFNRTGLYLLILGIDGRGLPHLRFAAMGPWQLVARRALRDGTVAALGCAATAIGVASAVARPRPTATAVSAAGFASAAGCIKFEPASKCEGIVKYWVKIANIATRRTVKVFVSGAVSSLALSPAGAAAWVVSTPAPGSSSSSSSTLYAIAVHPAGHGSLSGQPEVVDSGQSIGAVSFAGSTLRWSNGGQPKRQNVS